MLFLTILNEKIAELDRRSLLPVLIENKEGKKLLF